MPGPSYTGIGPGGQNPALSFEEAAASVTRATQKVYLWMFATNAVYGTIHKVNEVIDTWKQLEVQIERLGITTNSTGAELTKYFDQVASIAISMGTPLKDTVAAFDLVMRATAGTNNALGLVADRAERTAISLTLLRDASVLANISGMSYADSVDRLVGSLKQSHLGLDQGITLLDKWTAVSKVSASSVRDMAQGFSVMADVAGSMGLNTDKLSGLLAALSEVSPLSPTENANALKAIGSTIYNQESINTLGKYGISVREASGELRGFYEIMQELSAIRLSGILSDKQWVEIARAAGGGSRRYAQFMALLSSIPRMEQLATVSASAQGDALEANTRIVETLTNAYDRMAAAQQKLFMSVGQESGWIGGLTKSLNDLAKTVNELSKPVNMGWLKAIQDALPVVGALLALRLAGAGAGFIGGKLLGQGGKNELPGGLSRLSDNFSAARLTSNVAVGARQNIATSQFQIASLNALNAQSQARVARLVAQGPPPPPIPITPPVLPRGIARNSAGGYYYTAGGAGRPGSFVPKSVSDPLKVNQALYDQQVATQARDYANSQRQYQNRIAVTNRNILKRNQEIADYTTSIADSTKVLASERRRGMQAFGGRFGESIGNFAGRAGNLIAPSFSELSSRQFGSNSLANLGRIAGTTAQMPGMLVREGLGLQIRGIQGIAGSGAAGAVGNFAGRFGSGVANIGRGFASNAGQYAMGGAMSGGIAGLMAGEGARQLAAQGIGGSIVQTMANSNWLPVGSAIGGAVGGILGGPAGIAIGTVIGGAAATLIEAAQKSTFETMQIQYKAFYNSLSQELPPDLLNKFSPDAIKAAVERARKTGTTGLADIPTTEETKARYGKSIDTGLTEIENQIKSLQKITDLRTKLVPKAPLTGAPKPELPLIGGVRSLFGIKSDEAKQEEDLQALQALQLVYQDLKKAKDNFLSRTPDTAAPAKTNTYLEDQEKQYKKNIEAANYRVTVEEKLNDLLQVQALNMTAADIEDRTAALQGSSRAYEVILGYLQKIDPAMKEAFQKQVPFGAFADQSQNFASLSQSASKLNGLKSKEIDLDSKRKANAETIQKFLEKNKDIGEEAPQFKQFFDPTALDSTDKMKAAMDEINRLQELSVNLSEKDKAERAAQTSFMMRLLDLYKTRTGLTEEQITLENDLTAAMDSRIAKAGIATGVRGPTSNLILSEDLRDSFNMDQFNDLATSIDKILNTQPGDKKSQIISFQDPTGLVPGGVSVQISAQSASEAARILGEGVKKALGSINFLELDNFDTNTKKLMDDFIAAQERLYIESGQGARLKDRELITAYQQTSDKAITGQYMVFNTLPEIFARGAEYLKNIFPKYDVKEFEDLTIEQRDWQTRRLAEYERKIDEMGLRSSAGDTKNVAIISRLNDGHVEGLKNTLTGSELAFKWMFDEFNETFKKTAEGLEGTWNIPSGYRVPDQFWYRRTTGNTEPGLNPKTSSSPIVSSNVEKAVSPGKPENVVAAALNNIANKLPGIANRVGSLPFGGGLGATPANAVWVRMLSSDSQKDFDAQGRYIGPTQQGNPNNPNDPWKDLGDDVFRKLSSSNFSTDEEFRNWKSQMPISGRNEGLFPVLSDRADITKGHGKGGSDIFAPEGSPVVSMGAGKVTYAGADTIGGNVVLIRGEDGKSYYYAHLQNAPKVATGQKVSAGDLLGGVGKTGNAAPTPPHLHLGIGQNISTGVGAAGGVGGGDVDVPALLERLRGAGGFEGSQVGKYGIDTPFSNIDLTTTNASLNLIAGHNSSQVQLLTAMNGVMQNILSGITSLQTIILNQNQLGYMTGMNYIPNSQTGTMAGMGGEAGTPT